VLRAGDVLDPTELTEDIAPAAERVSGRLNAHNINEAVRTTVAADAEAYYTINHFATDAFFDWYNFVAGSHVYPDSNATPAASGASSVQNNFEWQTLDNSTYGTMRVTVSTGTSVLWVNAYAQYLWFGFDRSMFGGNWWKPAPLLNGSPGQHKNGAMVMPSGLQFAIRVDGNVIPETITGVDDTTYRASIPIKPGSQRTGTILLAPGPADARGEQICSLGPPCLPIRVSACVPVSPGDHIVELVVRRVPFVRSTSRGNTVGGSVQYGGYDNIYVYARQLNVIELKAHPLDSVAPFETTVSSFDEEEVLSAASLYTARVQPVIAAHNAVAEGGLQRGALMHRHLPAALRRAATTERAYSGSGPVFNNWFPDFEFDNDVTTIAYAGVPGVGWKLIDDSGADPIRVSNLNVADPCKVLVLVNMQVRNIANGSVNSEVRENLNEEPTTISAANIAEFALFKIMWQLSTASATDWIGVNESIGMVNNFVWWPKTPPAATDPADYFAVPGDVAYGLEHVEIQLMALLNFNSFLLNRSINIGAFGGVANDGCTYQVGRGNIIALVLRTP
jgi:hypothetical protein